MTFIAKYRSQCAVCEQDIQKGDEATFAAFDEVIHVKCPEDISTIQREVCPRCFLEKSVNGECGCD